MDLSAGARDRDRRDHALTSPALGLVTTGADDARSSASTDGVDLDAVEPMQPPYRPDGIARAGSGAGTTVWTSKCGQAGQPSAADAVLRLADTPT